VAIDRVRGPEAFAEVIEHLRGREPQATAMLAALLRTDSRRHRKVWVVRNGGAIVGVLASTRFCFDRWLGTLLLDDVSRAQEMAKALDRSNVWSVVGPFDALDAVLRHVTRYRASNQTRFHVVPYAPPAAAVSRDGPPADPVRYGEYTLRRARREDVWPLIALYQSDQRVAQIPRTRAAGIIRRALPYTLVAESSQGLRGAIMSSPAYEYALTNRLVVDPDARGGRLSFVMALHAGLMAMAERKGFCGFRPEPQGLQGVLRMMRSAHSPELAFVDSTVWINAFLWPPKRFRGHNRLRFAFERVEDTIGKPYVSRHK
jgi:hypothetical protein